jgi:hypothetical protein
MNKDFRKAIRLMEKAAILMQESKQEATKSMVAAIQCERYALGCYELRMVYRQWQLILLV